MKKIFMVLGTSLLVFLIAVAGFLTYKWLKLTKDTHNLQDKVATECKRFINEKKSVGIAICIVQGDKIYTDCFGYADMNSVKPVDTNTIFELGSITKVFTSELTQILVDRGVIKWEEAIYDILPPESKPLVNDNTTLLSLATHTSGFPRLPKELEENIKDTCNPYAGIKRSDYDFWVKKSTGKRKPDSNHYEYSNMAYGILADCLEAKTGTLFDSLLNKEIFGVLGMNHTFLHNAGVLNLATGIKDTLTASPLNRGNFSNRRAICLS